jgi:ribitol 2-dehydrogenase
MNLTTAVVLITGASSGIGAATARALAERGARVALVARSRDRLERLAGEIGEAALPILADVTRQADVDRMAQETLDQFGRLDVVFANAGRFIAGDLVDGDPEHWAEGIDLNITAVCRTLRATLPHLVAQRSGHVLLTASVAGRRWTEGQTIYCATKRAVYGIAEGLRLEMLPHNVHVTVVSPGWVANEFWDSVDHIPDRMLAQAVQDQRAIGSDDIAAGVVYVLTQPHRVNVSELMIRPLKQEH